MSWIVIAWEDIGGEYVASALYEPEVGRYKKWNGKTKEWEYYDFGEEL